MENCLFCKIVNKEIPCYKIYEDESILAFLDIGQGTVGHSLVISKKHYANLLEVDKQTLSHMIDVAQEIAKALMKLDGVKGINILNNCKEVAGQSINHFHIHVIPRYTIEDFPLEPKTHHELTQEEFVKLADDITKRIA